MPQPLQLSFATLAETAGRHVHLLVTDALVPPKAATALGPVGDILARAAAIEGFKGKAMAALDLVLPAGLACDRLTVVGMGPLDDLNKLDRVALGGAIAGKLGSKLPSTVIVAAEGVAMSPEDVADIGLGLRLRSYAFDRYKGKKDEEAVSPREVVLACDDPAAARRAFKAREAVADGVDLARDLVNEPPNVLTPAEFAKRASQLEKLGVEVTVWGEKDLRKKGFRALLGVGQGSDNESHVAILRWQGGEPDAAPIVLVGKGVCFDTGGISIKPAGGMEDMKGDMAGAAAVVGTLHALAARKARANVIGLIGLVENMPDGKAQRPGDIVTSLSGQTIEIINTDAEGRLVLADLLWFAQAEYEPACIIDLATLTGAIMVALGQEHAGLFASDDALADALMAAGKSTGEALWRLPLSSDYDKLIDSKVADVKNTGGRNAGAITAAQFLKRFTNGKPWAHLDIAGTGMAARSTETNRSWGSGFGVRLLDRFVTMRAEAAGAASPTPARKRKKA